LPLASNLKNFIERADIFFSTNAKKVLEYPRVKTHGE